MAEQLTLPPQEQSEQPLTEQQVAEQAMNDLGNTIDRVAYKQGAVETDFQHSYGSVREVMSPHDLMGDQDVIGSQTIRGANADVKKTGEQARSDTEASTRFEEQRSQADPFEPVYVKSANTRKLRVATDTESGKRITTDVELSGRDEGYSTQAVETRKVNGEEKYRHEMILDVWQQPSDLLK